MILAINQPYFLPYIGYFQLIAAADEFIVYDNLKYTKKGWINRNRLLRNGEAVTFSLPLKSAPDHLDIGVRELAADFSASALLNQIKGAYAKAPHYDAVMPLIVDIMNHADRNLFGFVHHSLARVCAYLEVMTPIVISSNVPIDHSLKSESKVLAVCEARGADTYLNAIGGTELYNRDNFANRGIELKFLKSQSMPYQQFGANFVPWLSILDVMMFCPLESIQKQLATGYEFV